MDGIRNRIEAEQSRSSATKVIVVGGGAAGLMAAGTAAEAGAEVIVLEKMKRPGRKLCISGKGRCNITNTADLRDFISHFGRQGKFLHQCFDQFFSKELVSFFERHGLELATERGGRIFPAQGKATDVHDVFLGWLKELNVQIRTSKVVDKLLLKGDHIKGVICKNDEILADSVILATGGGSYPATGSSGDGYLFTTQAGHTLVPVRPALVPLTTEKESIQGLAGLDLRNVNVRLYVNGKRKLQSLGEMGFTRFGVGGPVILTMSGYCVDCLRASKNLLISIDLKPALDDTKLDNRLQRDLQKRHNEEIQSILRGLLPKQLVPVCLQITGIQPHLIGEKITAKQRRRLRTWLKDFRLTITGYRPLKEAIVTAGGVNTQEIDPRTMESKKVQGLYIVGELLDIHGDTGGYNLQAAFSTGRAAGKAAAGDIKET